jgi:transcriptional regulator with XRE-family HTH domain
MRDKDDIRHLFGEAVRRARRNAGLSQEELADLAGLDRTYIGGVERGERNAGLVALQKIADGLGLPLAKLFADVKPRGKRG